MIVDAVDEAPSPAAMLGGFLLPLARQPGLSIVVGTRRHLLTDVRQADLVIDLDSEAYRDPLALADYIYRLLTAAEEPNVSTPYTKRPRPRASQEAQEARAVARAIAKRATSRNRRSESFLIGRLLALSVRARAEMVDITSPEWQSELPASVAEAFEEAWAGWAARPALRAPCCAPWPGRRGPGCRGSTSGPGWPRSWRGRAGGPRSDSVSDEDVRWLFRKAGAYVVKDLGPGGRSVYRLFHDLLATHLRDAPEPGHPARTAPSPQAHQSGRDSRDGRADQHAAG